MFTLGAELMGVGTMPHLSFWITSAGSPYIATCWSHFQQYSGFGDPVGPAGTTGYSKARGHFTQARGAEAARRVQ